MWQKFTSRKFLVAIIAIAGGMVVVLTEMGLTGGAAIAQKAAGAAIALAGILGYEIVEGKIDMQREE